MEQEFHRIKRLPPYVFAEVNAMKARARAAGEDIIDLGMGNPDQPTPKHIVDKLIEAAQNPRAHRYSMSRGIPGLRKALCGYYARRFNIELDPESETIVTLGSKEGLANLAAAITSPGDVMLVPNPSYPIHPFGFIIAGGAVRHIPVTPDKEFLVALDRAVRAFRAEAGGAGSSTTRRTRQPCLPIWTSTVRSSISAAITASGFCRTSPIPKSTSTTCRRPPILQVPGAKDIAIEFTSMSKTYNMPGWRIGFAAGNKTLISALSRIKSYLDYGAFTPLQVAAAAALNGPQDCVAEIRQMYKERRDVVIKGLAQAGWNIPSPPATMFAWAPIPPAFAHLGSVEFSKLLLREASVAVSPGIGFGEYGDTHVRIALVENVHRTRQAVRNMKSFLQSYDRVLEEAEKKRATGP